MKSKFIKVTAVDDYGDASAMYLNADVMPMALVDYGQDGTFINYDHTNGVLVRESVKEVLELYESAQISKKDFLN